MRRSITEIKLEFLRKCSEPICITRLLYATITSYSLARRLVTDLVKKGLLMMIEKKDLEAYNSLHGNQSGAWPGKNKLMNKRTYYKTSKKGTEVLRLYDQISEIFEN